MNTEDIENRGGYTGNREGYKKQSKLSKTRDIEKNRGGYRKRGGFRKQGIQETDEDIENRRCR